MILGARGGLRRHGRFQACGHFRQGSGGITKNADGGWVVLADLPRVGVEMDYRHAVGQRFDVAWQGQGKQVGADRYQQIMVLHRGIDRGAKARQRATI
jgi:hypothetical protein